MQSISQQQLNFPAPVLAAAAAIKAIILDVDGVLTDGGLYFSAEGESLKRFNSLDGLGLHLLTKYTQVKPIVITGRDSEPLRQRLDGLGITMASYGCLEKLPQAQKWLEKIGCGWQQAAMLGDDWIDLPLLARCGLAVAPTNAHAEVLARVNYVTKASGGNGAVRELCDLLLQAHGCYEQVLQRYLA